MACFVDIQREILALKFNMSWLGQHITGQAQALPPAQQFSIFQQLLLESPSNNQLLAAEAKLRQTHTRITTSRTICLNAQSLYL